VVVCGYSELQSHVDIRDGVRQHTAGVLPGMDRPVRHGEGVIFYDRKAAGMYRSLPWDRGWALCELMEDQHCPE